MEKFDSMKFKALGKTGERIPAVGIGTWKLGTDRDTEMKAIRVGLELGMRMVDTAELYANESLVGKAIEGEEGVLVATKVSPNHLHADDIENSCNQSLKALGVKTIDLYQIHWPNSKISVSETMAAMEKLVKEGKIRYIGVSNFSVKELEEAQGALKSNEIVSNQVEYSVVVRDPERTMLDYARKNSITIIAYSPLGAGALFSKRLEGLYGILDQIGKKHGKSPAQVALNWLVSKDMVVAIPKASNADHMRENAGGVDFSLDRKEMLGIDSFRVKAAARTSTSRFHTLIKNTAPLWSDFMADRYRKKLQK